MHDDTVAARTILKFDKGSFSRYAEQGVDFREDDTEDKEGELLHIVEDGGAVEDGDRSGVCT